MYCHRSSSSVNLLNLSFYVIVLFILLIPHFFSKTFLQEFYNLEIVLFHNKLLYSAKLKRPDHGVHLGVDSLGHRCTVHIHFNDAVH